MGVKAYSTNTDFQDALSKLIPKAITIFTQVIENIPEEERPDEASVEFGVVLSNDIGIGAFISQSTTENTLKITLVWTSENN